MANPNNGNNNQPTTEENNQIDFKGHIDPVSVRTLGVSDLDARSEGYNVIPMNLNESFEVNKSAYLGMDLMTYKNNVYDPIMGQEVENIKRSRNYALYRDPDLKFLADKINAENAQKPGIPFNTHPSNWGIDERAVVGWTLYDGNKTRGEIGKTYVNSKKVNTMTLEQRMESKNKYYNPATLKVGYLDEYKMANMYGSPFKVDEDGNEWMLVADPDTEMWAEVPADAVIEGRQLRSMYTPQDFNSGVAEHAMDMSYNTMMDMAYGQWGTAAEAAGQIYNWISGEKGLNSWQKWGRTMQNYGNSVKSKISEAAENEGMFDSYRGFAGMTSSILTQAGAQFLIGRLTMGAGTALQALGKGGVAAQRIISGAPWLFGSIYAGNAMNEEAKAAGLSDNDRMLLSLAAAGTVYAAELGVAKFLGGSGIADGFKSAASQKALLANVRNKFNGMLAKELDNFISPAATAATKGAGTKTIVQKIASGFNNFAKGSKKAGGSAMNFLGTAARYPISLGYSKAPKSFWGRTGAGVSAAWEEGWEEVFEGQVNAWTKELYNNGYLGIDGPADNAEPGKGLFENTKYDHFFSDFVGGMIGGGVIGAIAGGRMKRSFTDFTLAELSAQYDSWEKAAKELTREKERGYIHNSLLNVNDAFVSVFDQKEQKAVKSRNDIAFETMLEELKVAFQIKEALGLHKPETIAKVMGGDMTLVKDTIEKGMRAKKLDKEIEQKKNILDNTNESDPEYNSIKKDYDDAVAEKNQIKQQVDKIMSGQAISDYKAHMAAREFIANNEYQKRVLTALQLDDEKDRKKAFENLWSESIESAERKDLWSDQEKALELVGRLKNYAETYNQLKIQNEEYKKESKKLLDEIDANFDVTDDAAFKSFIDKIAGKYLFENDYKDMFSNIQSRIAKEKEAILGQLIGKYKLDENIDETDFTDNSPIDNTLKGFSAISRMENGKINVQEARALEDEMSKDEDFVKYMNLLENSKQTDARSNTLIKEDTNYLPGAGLYKDKNGNILFNQMEDLYQDEVDLKPEYYSIALDQKTPDKQPSNEKDYDTLLKSSNAKEVNKGDISYFDYNGRRYVKENTKKARIKGGTEKDGSYKEEERYHDYFGIDLPMKNFLNSGDTLNGKKINEILKELRAEYSDTGIVSDEMKQKLKDVKKYLDDKDTMLGLLNWAKNLKSKNILDENQVRYFGIDKFDQMQDGIQAWIAQHNFNKLRYQDTKQMLESKADREAKLKILNERFVKMFGTIANQLQNFIQADDIVVNGVAIQKPDILSMQDGEAEVMKVLQYWHHYVNQLDDNQKNDFLKQFKVFWHVIVQKMKSTNGAIIEEYIDNDVYHINKAKNQGMFQEDFESLFDDVMFEVGTKPGESNTNHYRELFYYHTINMIMNMDVATHYKALVETILDEITDPATTDLTKTKYPGDHTSEQLYAVLNGAVHIQENINRKTKDKSFIALLDNVKDIMKIGTIPKTGKTWSLYEPKVDSTGKVMTDGKHIKDNVQVVFGSGGVGKTTFFVKTMVDLAISKGIDQIVLVAPNRHQLDAIKKVIDPGMEKYFKTYLIEDYLKVQDKLNNALIFVDEISLLSQKQKNSLYFNGRLSTVKGQKVDVETNVGELNDNNVMFLLGDELQAPYSIEEEEVSPKLSEYAQHSFSITSVKRSSYVDIYRIQNAFRSQSVGLETVIPLLPELNYSNENGRKRGVRLNNDKSSFMGEAMEAVKAENGYIITYDAKQYNDIVSNLDSKLHNRVFYMTDKTKSPQGMTLEGEVYVYLPYEEMVQINDTFKTQPLYYNRYALTAVSRAKEYVSLYTGEGLGNTNSKLVPESNILKFEDNNIEKAQRMKEQYQRISAVANELIDVPTKENVDNNKADEEAKEDEIKENIVDEETDTEEAAENISDTEKNDDFVEDEDFINIDEETEETKTREKAGRKNKREKRKYERKRKNKKQEESKEKTNELKEYDTEDSNSNRSEAKEDDFITITPSSGKPVDDRTKVVSELFRESVSALVTNTGYIIKIGATYKFRDGDKIIDVKVQNIQESNGNYYIVTDAFQAPIESSIFENKTKQETKDNFDKNTALANFLTSGVFTVYGNLFTSDNVAIAATQKETARNYRNALTNLLNIINNQLGNKVKVNIKIAKNKTYIDYKGKSYDKELAIVIEATTNTGKKVVLSTMFLESIDDVNNSSQSNEQKLYSDFLYNLLKNKIDGEVIATNVVVDKNDILVNEAIGFAKDGNMSYNELVDFATSLGFYISTPVQVKDINTKNKETSSTIIYLSKEKNPDKNNGVPVYVESIQYSKANQEQKGAIKEYVRQLNLETESTTTDEATLKRNNDKTENFFRQNKPELQKLFNAGMLPSSVTSFEGLYGEKTTFKDKHKQRTDVLKDILEDLDTEALVYSGIRLPNIVDKTSEGVELKNNQHLVTRQQLYLVPPVLRIYNVSDNIGVKSNTLYDKVNSQLEFDEYTTAESVLYERLNDLLGEGLALQLFTNEKYHGFVDKFGKIGINMINGYGRLSTLDHEIIHYVSEFLLTDNARAILFDEIASKNPSLRDWRTNMTSRIGVAEKLADGGKRYREDRRNLKGISKYMQMFYDTIARFFNNIFGIKSAVNDFYRDLFEFKKYKSPDNKALAPLRDEMDLDYLFSRNKIDMATVENYFYSRDVARTATQLVSNVMYNEALAPTLNPRFFKDKEMSFSDMVNRAEWMMRQKVMFEFDMQNGREFIKRKNQIVDGVEFKDLPVIRGLNVMEGANAMPLFKYALNPFDSNNMQLQGLHLMYYNRETKSYEAAPVSNKDIYFLDSYSRNSIRKDIRKALQTYRIQTSSGYNSVLDLTDNGKQKMSTIVSDSDKRFYQYAMTMIDEVFAGMVNNDFPDVDILSYMNKYQRVSFNEILDNLNKINDANIKRETEEVNPMDRQSAIMKIIVNNTPLVLIQNGEPVISDYTINPIIAEVVMNEVNGMVYTAKNGNIKSSIEGFKEALKKIINDYKNNVNKHNFMTEDILNREEYFATLYSMYNVYFSDQEMVDGISHYDIVKYRDRLMSVEFESEEYNNILDMIYDDYTTKHSALVEAGKMSSETEVLSKEDFAIGIKNRANLSEKVLTSLISYYANNARNSYTMTKMFGKGKDAKFYSYNMLPVNANENKDSFQRSIYSSIYDNGIITDRYRDLFGFNTDLKLYSPVVTETGDKLAPVFFMRTDGVYMNYGKTPNSVVQLFAIENNEFKLRYDKSFYDNYASTHNKINGLQGIIENVFLHFFNRSDKGAKHVSKKLSEKKVSKSSSGIEDVANILMPLMLSTYVHTRERIYGQENSLKDPVYNAYMNALNEFNKAQNRGENYGKISLEYIDIANSETMSFDEAQAGDDMVYFPSQFYMQIEEIAKLQSDNYYENSIRSIKKNRRVYIVNVQDTVGHLQRDNNNRLVDDFNEFLENNNGQHFNHNARSKRVLNPVLGTKGFVGKKTTKMGIKADNLSAELTDMSPADNFASDFSDFMKSANVSAQSFAFKPVSLPFFNQAQRTRQGNSEYNFKSAVNFDLSRTSNGLMIRNDDGTIDLDYKSIFSYTKRRFQMLEEAQVNSLNNWILYMNAANNTNIEPIDTSIPGWKAARDQAYKMVQEYVSGSNFEIVDGNVINFQRTNNLIKGKDYLIFENDSTGISSIALGYETNMFSNIYLKSTIDNTNKIYFSPAVTYNYENYNMTKEIEYNYTNPNTGVVSVKKVKIKIQDLLDAFNENTGLAEIKFLDESGENNIMVDDDIYKLFIESLYQNHFSESNRIMKDSGYISTKENTPSLNLTKTDYVYGISHYGKILPEWKAFIIGFEMVNAFQDNAIEGTEAIEMDNRFRSRNGAWLGGKIKYNQNANKRKTIWSSTGQLMAQGVYNGLDNTTKILHVEDLLLSANISGVNGEVIANNHIVNDGGTKENPITLRMHYNSHAANYGSSNKYGPGKTVNLSRNLNRAFVAKKKHARDSITEFLYESSPDDRKWFHIFNNIKAKPYSENASALMIDGLPAFKTIDDLNNLDSYYDTGIADSMLQRFFIFYDNTSTEKAAQKTIANIANNTKYDSVKDLIETFYKNDIAQKNAKLKEWNKLQNRGLGLGKMIFLTELLNEAGEQDAIEEDDNIKDWDKAIDQLVENYSEIRYFAQQNPNNEVAQQQYKTLYESFISGYHNASARKEQAKGFTMPYKSLTPGAGSSTLIPMPYYSPIGDNNVYDNIFDLWDAHLNNGGMPDNVYNNILEDYDNTTELVQLNPNRPTDDTEETPIVQGLSVIIANPNSVDSGLAKKITDKLSDLINLGLKDMVIKLGLKSDMTPEEIYDRLTNDRNSSVNEIPNLNIAEIEKFIKNKIKKGLSNTDDSTLLSVIINDENISINVSPGAQTRVIQYLSAFIKKESVKRKVEAIRLAQMAGNHIQLLELNGEVFTYGQAKKHAEALGTTINQLFDLNQSRSLKHTTIKQKEQALTKQQQAFIDNLDAQLKANTINQKQYYRLKMNYLKNQNLLQVEKGEVIVPASKFDSYDIPKDMGLNEIFRIYTEKDGSTVDNNFRNINDYNQIVNDLKNIVKENIDFNIGRSKVSNKIVIKTFYKEGIVKGKNRYFDLMFNEGLNQELSKQRGSITKEVNKQYLDLYGKEAYDAFLNDSYSTNNERLSAIENYNKLLNAVANTIVQDYLNNQINKYAKALKAIQLTIDTNVGMRIPSGPGSGFVANVVGFVNDNGSVGYVNTIKNLIDGSDQDIDQFTLYYSADTLVDLGIMSRESFDQWKREQYFSKDENKISNALKEEANMINNELFSYIKEYYSSVDNTNYTLTPINLDPVKNVAESAYRKLFPRGDYSYNYGQSILYRKISMDGRAVGPFALAQKVQTLLYSAYHLNGKSGISTDLYPFSLTKDDYEMIPIWMEMLVNAATDNPKLLALGALNININNADMVSSMFFAHQEILDHVNAKIELENLSNPTKPPKPLYTKETLPYAIFELLASDAHEEIYKYASRQGNMIDGGFAENYFAISSKYYQSLYEGYTANQNLLNETTLNITNSYNTIVNALKRLEIADSVIYNTTGLSTTENAVDDIMNFIYKNNISEKISKKAKAKHLVLKALIDKELHKKAENFEDDAIISAIDNVMNQNELQKSAQLFQELVPDSNATVNEAMAQSAELSEILKDLFQAVRNYKTLARSQKILSKKTDKQGFVKDVYLISKYSMLGEWMKDAIKIANINQFNISSSYDILKTEKQILFATGFTISELLSHYDSYNELKKNNKSLTPSEYFSKYTSGINPEYISEKAFSSKKHELMQNDKSWMNNEIEYDDEVFSYRNDFHKIANMHELILARPDIVESFRAVQTMKAIEEGILIKSNKGIKQLHDEILDELGYDLWSEEKYNTFYEQVNNLFVAEYLHYYNDENVEKTFAYRLQNAMQRFGLNDLSQPMYAIENTGMKSGVRNGIEKSNFIKQFPEFFMNVVMPKIIEMDKSGEYTITNDASKFLDRLNIKAKNNINWLDVRKSNFVSPSETEMLRSGFSSLHPDVQMLLIAYQLIKDGFNYSTSFFGQVMPKNEMIEYTNFINENFSPKNESKIKGRKIGDNKWRNLENLKMNILSNPNLNLSRYEQKLKIEVEIDGKTQTRTIGIPPVSANGIVRFYNKTIQRRKFRNRTEYTYGLVETYGINGVGISRSSATEIKGSPVVNFNSIINIVNDDLNAIRPISIYGLNFEANMNPFAYMRYVIHGHAEDIVTKKINEAQKLNPEIPLTENDVIAIIQDFLTKTDFNKSSMRLKGTPRLKNLETYQENKASIQSETLELIKQSILQSAQNNNIDPNELISNLKGKVIADKYYYNEMSMSYILYATLNSLGADNINFDNFAKTTKVPTADNVQNTYIESPALRNRNGLIGNYHRLGADPLVTKDVVQLHLPNLFGRGRKDNWYILMNSLGYTGSDSVALSNQLLAKILFAKSFDLNDDIVKQISGGENLNIPAGELITQATNTYYSHLDSNVSKQQSQKHAVVLQRMKDAYNRGSDPMKMISDTSLQLSLRWTKDIPYNVGDVIYFSDGTEGIVTRKLADNKEVSYVLKYNEGIDHVFTPTSKTNNALMSLENLVSENNAHKALDGFIKVLSRAMPNTPYEIISDEQAREISRSKNKNSVSFYQDGIVYINKDKADYGVALHEFAHPLVIAIKETNEALYNAMAELVSKSPVMDYVIDNYSDELSPEEMIMEAIPTYLQMRYYSRFRENLSSADSKTVDDFYESIKALFKDVVTDGNVFESGIDNLDFGSATMNQIADAILNDIIRNSLPQELVNHQIRRIVPYTMRASTSSKIKNISLSNINQLFQNRGSFSDEDAAKRDIKKNIRSYNNFEGFTGTYDLTMNNPLFYDTMNRYSDDLRDKYINKIVDEEYKAYENITDKALMFFNSLTKYKPLKAATDTLYASWNKRYDMKDNAVVTALENDVINIMDKIGFNHKTDLATTLDGAMQYLGIRLPSNIKNKNVIVIIHNKNTDNQSISLLSVMNTALGNYGSTEKATLGESYKSEEMNPGDNKKSRRLNGLHLNNTNSSIEAVKNTVIAMAIKKQLPKTKIRSVGAMKFNGNGVNVQKRNINELLSQVNILFNSTPQLKENLERDFYDIVTDQSLYDSNLYNMPLLERLQDYFKSLLSENENDKYKISIEKTLESINNVKTSNMFSFHNALRSALKSRIVYLQNQLGSQERIALDEEYQYISKMYMELTGYKERRTSLVTPMTLDEKLIGTADRWSGQIKTWVFDQLDLARRKSVSEALPFVETVNKMTIEYNQMKGGILSKVADKSHDLFMPIFKKKQIKDKNGNIVTVSLHELHWDLNDVDTAKAISNGEITKEDVAFGKYIADSLYNEFVEYVMVTERAALNNRLSDGEETLRFAAETYVNSRYKKGMLPVFQRSVGSALNDSKINEAWNRYMKTASRWYGGSIYEEYQQSDMSDLQKETFKKMMSPFWNQFQSSIEHGGDYRLQLLGLDYDGNELVLMNKKNQDEMSFNLQNIANFAMYASVRAKHMQEGIFSVNLAMDMLRGVEKTRGINTQDIREHLENYVNRQVYGNMPSLTKMMVDNVAVDVDSLLDGTGKLINMIHLALNIKLGAKNAVASASKLLINAMVNSLSGRKSFNLPAVTRALGEMFNNPEKIQALNKKYQIVNVSERDIINHWTKVHTRKNITEPDMQMIMHYIGDHYAQLVGAMAQMMVEGTYDAHDNQGNYNYKLDKRFYADNGEMKILGTALYNSILEQQYKEGYHIPKDGKTLTHAYSQRDENRIKVEVQRFVGELTDSSFKNMMSSYVMARSVMSLKSYIYNVAQAWWKNPYESVQTGARKVYMKDGQAEVDWDPELTEGIIQTLIYCTKGLAKAVKGDVSDFKNMSSYQKRNLISMATFTAVVGGIFLLADLLSWGDDDDKKKKKYKYVTDPKTGKKKRVDAEDNPEWISSRLMEMLYVTRYTKPDKDESSTYAEELMRYVLLGAVNEQLSYVSPFRPIQDMLQSPNPYIYQGKNIANLLWTTLTLPTTIRDEGMLTAADKIAFSASKNLPFGSIYRTGHEYVDSFIDFLDNDLKK